MEWLLIICSDGSCSAQSGDPCSPDTECNEVTDSCDPITMGTLLLTLKEPEDRGQVNSLENAMFAGGSGQGGWNSERVDDIDEVGLHTSLALD